MYTISKFIFLSLYIVALPIILEVSYVLHLWLGNDVPDYTGIFTILVLVTTLVDILSTPIGMVVAASGHVARFDFWNSVLGIAALPLAYVFLVNGGNPVSVFIASLTASVAMQIATIFIMKKETGIKISNYLRSVILPLIGVVLSTALFPWLVSHFLNEGFFRLVIVTLVSVIVILLSGLFIGLDASERSLVLSYASRFLNKIRPKKHE